MFKVKSLSRMSTIIALTLVTTAYASPYSTFENESQLAESYEKIADLIADNEQLKFQQLVESGFDINTIMKGEGTPLTIAIKHHQNQFARQLIALGADIELIAPQDANPLINAAQHNNIEMAKLLLAQGALVDAIVVDDETALISASRAGHTEMVKLLVASGADVNLGVEAKLLSGVELRTPLNGAKNNEIANFLRVHGAEE